jgi:DNA gyrase subunit A
MALGSIQPITIEQEMRTAYLDYAMSTIVARALPDARDGLKPVHRRILYAMYDMGIRPDSPYKKSARIVGEVLGKYHPHGDSAVYDALVRLAQDFSMRYCLIDGQGNFGSIDGDSAAAMRYTEARIAPLGAQLLADIEKDTVDFSDNFDGSLTEPQVLPAALPNLLINGASGIAVGMSTNIPPHNLGEIVDALVYMLSHWNRLEEISTQELMQFVKGPDFPTGGVIYSHHENETADNPVLQAYATGRGKVTVRAKVHIEDIGRGKSRIIVSELPYQVNKTSLIERIAHLANTGKLDGLSDLRDESDRQNQVRLVIELQRGVDASEVLANLFKLTPLQETFSIIMLALVDQQPRLLSLKQALRVYLEHRLEIVRRRSEYDLARARERAHILEGLLKALDRLDEVIALIRRSKHADAAREGLKALLDITDVQAQAILDMQLRRLAALEAQKILEEYQEKIALIQKLEALLADPKKMRVVIAEELAQLKLTYGDKRRTIVADGFASNNASDYLIPEEAAWITLTTDGILARIHDNAAPKVPASTKQPPRCILNSSTAQVLYLFTARGVCATVPVQQIPPSNDFSTGTAFYDLTPLKPEDSIAAALGLDLNPGSGFLFMTTRSGKVKRLRLEELPGIVAKPFVVMNVAEDDELISVFATNGSQEVILITAQAQAIRFREDEVRPTGLPSGGMIGVKLAGPQDRVVAALPALIGRYVWNITDDGIAKISAVDEYPTQGRAGGGVISMRLPRTSRELAAAAVGQPDDSLIVLTNRFKPLQTRIRRAPIVKRGRTGGEAVVTLRDQERVVAVVTYQPRIEPLPTNSAPSENPADA